VDANSVKHRETNGALLIKLISCAHLGL